MLRGKNHLKFDAPYFHFHYSVDLFLVVSVNRRNRSYSRVVFVFFTRLELGLIQ